MHLKRFEEVEELLNYELNLIRKNDLYYQGRKNEYDKDRIAKMFGAEKEEISAEIQR